jgi:hypothetical protein
MPKKTLLDDVVATLPTRRGFRPWNEVLPSDIAAEVEEIKRQFISGELSTTKSALAMSLSRALKARGIQIGHMGVARWLEK